MLGQETWRETEKRQTGSSMELDELLVVVPDSTQRT